MLHPNSLDCQSGPSMSASTSGLHASAGSPAPPTGELAVSGTDMVSTEDVSMEPIPAVARPLRMQPSEDLCKICFEGVVNTILLKCGHIAFCLECANQLERCPICRTQIDEVVQTFRA
jgi:hypothetical protein